MSSGRHLPLGLPGLPSIKNLGAMDWNPNGLAAIGNGPDIIILDTNHLKSLLYMPSEHKSSVNQILWNPHARPFLPEKSDKQTRDLISADTSNTIIMWDVERCQSVAHFNHSESSRTLLAMKWSNASDTWLKTKLFLLYSGSLFVVLDIGTLVYQNISIVDGTPASADYNIFDFDCDPYCPNFSSSLALLGDTSVYFVSHWDPLKMKQEKMTISSKVMYISKNSSPRPAQGTGESQQQNKRHSSSSGIRKLVSEIIVGSDFPSNQVPATSLKSDGAIQFHRNLKYHLIVSNSRSIYLINTQFRVILNTFSMERGMSNLVQVILSHKRPAVITLHENGAIALRKYVISGSHTQSVTLETVHSTDPPRLSAKKSEVLGAMLEKNNENQVILHVNDGRFISYNILRSSIKSDQASSKMKHLSTPMTPFVTSVGTDSLKSADKLDQSTTESKATGESIDQLISTILEPETSAVRLKLKKTTTPIGILTCLKSSPGIDFIVAGTSLGFILIIKIEDDGKQRRCVIRKRFAVHCSTPVSGIEFVSDNEIITYANLSFSANPKCEMIMLELSTGASRVLKQDEPNHIGFLRISPLGQYFLLVYKNGMAPCELWDLPRRQLIKTLPSKLPPITSACWKEAVEGVKDESFFMTDLGTFLFTFRVDGNRFANATCVKLDTAGNTGGIPVSLIVKGKLVFRADSSGTLVIYDMEKKTASPGVNLGRGPLHKIEAGFGDYAGYFIAQFNEQIELWHLSDVKKIKVLHAGKAFKASDLCWMDGYLATIPRTSGGIKFLPVTADLNPSIPSQIFVNYPYFLSSRDKCYRLFDIMKENFSNQAFLNLFQEVCAFEESAFWSVITTSMMSKVEPGWKPSVQGFNLYSENHFYKEVIVRLAQCVWFCDMSKREEVAKILLLAGESEKAAEILLDTEPSDPVKYIANGMKAALSVGASGLPESTKAVLKITATNLIASGQIDDGLEILCLLSKHSEAAKYMESSNDWSKAILLSKTSLSLKQSQECLGKYGHFLNSQRQVLKSASIYAYVGKYDRAIEVLFGGRKRHLCYLLLIVCEKFGVELTNLSDHVKLAIRLDFARFIFDCGLFSEAIKFCDEIGEEAKDLKSELEILGF